VPEQATATPMDRPGEVGSLLAQVARARGAGGACSQRRPVGGLAQPTDPLNSPSPAVPRIGSCRSTLGWLTSVSRPSRRRRSSTDPTSRHTKGSAARAVQARRRSRSTRGHEVKKQRPGGLSDKQESGVRGWRRGAAAARSSRMPCRGSRRRAGPPTVGRADRVREARCAPRCRRSPASWWKPQGPGNPPVTWVVLAVRYYVRR